MNKSTGITLLDFLAASTIMATVSVTVIPGMHGLLQNNRLTAQTNNLVAAIHLTRSEAIKRRVPVVLCKKNPSATNCDKNPDWQQGWIIFADTDSDNERDPEEPLIRVYQALPADLTLTGNRPLSTRIRFNAKGYSNGYNGRMILCDSRGDTESRVLTLSSTGRLRVTGHDEQPSGSRLSCPD